MEFYIKPKVLSVKVVYNPIFFILIQFLNIYGNIAWESTTQTKLKKLTSCQSIRIIYDAEHANEKMEEILTFMFKVQQ